MSDGIYGCFNLGGAALGNEELAWLGVRDANSGHDQWIGHESGFRLRDSLPLPGDTGWCINADQVIGFLGDLDNRNELAALVGLPVDTAAAQLAGAAWRQYGEQSLKHVEGQWTLLVWDVKARQLTLAASRNLRDSIYVCAMADRVALSPSIQHLQTLRWVPKGLDDLGLLIGMARAPLRAKLGSRTWHRDVMQLQPGTVHTIQMNKHAQSTWAVPLSAEQWTGDYHETVELMEARCRTSIRQRIRRHKTLAVLLSGGLDSSTLAALAAVELRSDQKLIAVSSAASSGSGIEDERRWIDLVARVLGIDVHYVTPGTDWDVYFPSLQTISHAESPLNSSRHYLYEKLFAAAVDVGADAVLDGCYGEQSLTRPYSRLSGVRRMKKAASIFLRQGKFVANQWQNRDTLDLFHIPLTARARDLLSRALVKNLPAAALPVMVPPPEQAMGFPKGYTKAGLLTEATQIDGLRRLYPFRTPALLTLSAALPGKYFEWGGQSRAISRSILGKYFPDELRGRRDKKPFSPEHISLLQRSAATQLNSLDQYGSAEAWEWVDQAWLRTALGRIAAGDTDIRTRDAAQAGCFALAFFQWQQSI